jgi:uncharacterized protein (DUF1330 family)
MAKGYWIVRADVKDAKGFKAYVQANAEAAIALRKPYSEIDIVIVEGYEGPQP